MAACSKAGINIGQYKKGYDNRKVFSPYKLRSWCVGVDSSIKIVL